MKEGRREKEEERKWDGTHWWGAEGEERFLLWGSPLTGMETSWDRRGASGGSEESAATCQWQVGQTETYTDGPCHSPVCSNLKWLSASVHGGWGLEHGVWRADPGKGLLLAARRQPEGMGVRSSANVKAHGRSGDHHRSEAPLLSDTQRAGPPLQPLSSHTGPSLLGH